MCGGAPEPDGSADRGPLGTGLGELRIQLAEDRCRLRQRRAHRDGPRRPGRLLVDVVAGTLTGVNVGVLVGVDVGVLVGVDVGVFVGVRVDVDVGVFVGVLVGV